jgi:uncharacterized protein
VNRFVRFTHLWLFSLPLLLGGGSAPALELPGSPANYIHDGAQVLSPAQTSELTSLFVAEDHRSGNQVLVATFPSLDGEEPVDFVNRLFHKWNPGQKGKDNGVVFAVFLKEHKIRIEVGYGLEPFLTDAATKRILEESVKPRFRSGDIGLGILEGSRAIVARLKDTSTDPSPRRSGRDPKANLVLLFIVALLWIILGRAYRTTTLTSRGQMRNSRGYDGFGSPYDWPSGPGRGGDAGFGGGGSDGGFSGGGGSSGGGGASGDW